MGNATATLVSPEEKEQEQEPTTVDDISVRFLTYNLFMRPPGISKPTGDFKSQRLKILGQRLTNFDIVCFQELFTAWSDRPHKLSEAVKKDGYKYFVHAPSPPLTSMRVVDAGLTVMSKHPITNVDFVLYKHANSSDTLAGKGILYMSVLLGGSIPIHLFNTHMQASYNDTMPASRATRKTQFKQMRNFICKHATDGNPVIFVGDFNVDSREDLDNGLRDGKEYQYLLTVLSGDCDDDLSKKKKKKDKELDLTDRIRFDVRDLLREKEGYHPITYGDIERKEEGDSRSKGSGSSEPKKKEKSKTKEEKERDSQSTGLDSSDRGKKKSKTEGEKEEELKNKERNVKDAVTNDWALTFPEEYASQKRLDYIFLLTPRKTQSDVRAKVQKNSASVEPFYVTGEKFTQLSDHYGVSAVVQFSKKSGEEGEGEVKEKKKRNRKEKGEGMEEKKEKKETIEEKDVKQEGGSEKKKTKKKTEKEIKDSEGH